MEEQFQGNTSKGDARGRRNGCSHRNERNSKKAPEQKGVIVPRRKIIQQDHRARTGSRRHRSRRPWIVDNSVEWRTGWVVHGGGAHNTRSHSGRSETIRYYGTPPSNTHDFCCQIQRSWIWQEEGAADLPRLPGYRRSAPRWQNICRKSITAHPKSADVFCGR